MRKHNCGYTLVEMMVTTVVIGALGLIIYSILVAGTILGAKNTAVNVAHQQARTAMLDMLQSLHSSISLPQLVDATGNAVGGAGPAAGISFQIFNAGPYQVWGDVATSTNKVTIALPTSAPAPTTAQRLIIQTHQIENNITTVANAGNATINGTTYSLYTLTLDSNVFNAITGSTVSPNNIACFLAYRCSYIVNNQQQLTYNGPTKPSTFANMANYITNNTPFKIPTTPAGALYYSAVAAVNLSTSDLQYSNRGFQSANILLNGQVPARTRLTTYQ
ncbi:MAG: prepilin-type N-terminal cleavage/methylation domain-containing protein [Verrucomicrobiota bacterium]|nr:prepilin-type N-terminal cleavage/methylation domain-containing protein [Verrucomicrobiota bacterium]